MVKFLLWCILLVLCWPLALLALVLYPIVWLLLLPFRVLGDSGRGSVGAATGRHHASGALAGASPAGLSGRTSRARIQGF